jgi:hypothetical protein
MIPAGAAASPHDFLKRIGINDARKSGRDTWLRRCVFTKRAERMF